MTETNACCQDPTNRTEQETTAAGIVIQRCKCGRRHFEMTVDPATLGLTFT